MTLEKVDIAPTIPSLHKHGDEIMKARKKIPEDALVEFEDDDLLKAQKIHVWLFDKNGNVPAIKNVALAGNGATISWRCLVSVLRDYCLSSDAIVMDKQDAMLASFWRFKDPYGRCEGANSAAMTLLVLDYDGLASYDEVRGDLESRGYAYFMHTTFSSTGQAKPRKKVGALSPVGIGQGVDKFRVFIPIREELLVVDMTPSLQAVVLSKFPGIDRSCLTVARRFYLPSCRRGGRVRFDSSDGKAFDMAAANIEAKISRDAERKIYKALGVDVGSADPIFGGDEKSPSVGESQEWYCNALDALAIFRDKGWYIRQKTGGWHYVRCPEGHLHSDGNPEAQLRTTQGDAYFQFKCHHGHEGVDHGSRWLYEWLVKSETKEYLDQYRKRIPRKSEDLDAEFPGKVIRLNKRYLAERTGDEILADMDDRTGSIKKAAAIVPVFSVGDARTVFIKSPKGTGKTDVIRRLVDKYCSIICITHRVSLADELCNRVGLTNYQKSLDGCRLGICMDSLKKLSEKRNVKTYDVVFIDESEQALAHLTGPTMKESRLQVLSVLRHIVAKAKLVICADADLSQQITVKHILALRGEQQALFVNNEVKLGGSYYFYRSKLDAVAAMFDYFLKYPESRCWLATNSRANIAGPVYGMARHAGINSILITSETVASPEVQAFLAEPAEYIRKHNIRLVIASPTISTGFNLDAPGLIDRVYGVFGANCFTAQDCDQAMHRVRHVESRHIWVKQTKPYDLDEIGRNAKEKHEALMKSSYNSLVDFEDKENLKKIEAFERDYSELVFDIEIHSARFSFSREDLLAKNFECMGAKVERFSSDLHSKPVLDELKIIWNMHAMILESDRVNKVLNARRIGQCEYEEISKLRKKTEDQRYAEMRFQLVSALHKNHDALTEYDVRSGWERVEKFRNICGLLENQAELLKKDGKEVANGVLALDRAYFWSTSDLLTGLMAVSGISLARIITQCNHYLAVEAAFIKSVAGMSSTSNRYKVMRRDFRKEVKALELRIEAEHIDSIVEIFRNNAAEINALLGVSFKIPVEGHVSPQIKGKIVSTIYSNVSVELKGGPKDGYSLDFPETVGLLRGFGIF
ncbi:MAG: plasmid replication protein, CyRepA1 family [Alcanivoracaceae bacterium]